MWLGKYKQRLDLRNSDLPSSQSKTVCSSSVGDPTFVSGFGNDWNRGSGGHLRVLCMCDFFIRVNSASPCMETIFNWLMSVAYGSIGLIPKITEEINIFIVLCHLQNTFQYVFFDPSHVFLRKWSCTHFINEETEAKKD